MSDEVFALLGDSAGLRPLLPRHADELASCVDGAREHLSPWTVLASRVTYVNSAYDLLEHYADPPRYFGIWLDGALVGGALYRTFDDQTGICEIGGWLIPGAEGRGLITLAFRQMIEWASQEGMHRIELRASPENIRATAIAKRLGMTHEATLRSAFVLNGIRHHTEVWSILLIPTKIVGFV